MCACVCMRVCACECVSVIDKYTRKFTHRLMANDFPEKYLLYSKILGTVPFLLRCSCSTRSSCILHIGYFCPILLSFGARS